MVRWPLEMGAPLPSPLTGKKKLMTDFLQRKQTRAAAAPLHFTLQPIAMPNSNMPNLSFMEEEGEEEEEEEEEEGKRHSQLPAFKHSENSNPNLPCPTVTYSLSSGARYPSSASRISRSRPVRQCTNSPPPRSSFLSPPSDPRLLAKFSTSCSAQTSPFDDLPHIHPSDYLKTLLSQLAASISAMKTAYAHQQAALNPYNLQGVGGRRQSFVDTDISAADKAMVKELERLSYLHSQLSLLPHMQLQYQEQDTDQSCRSETCSCGGADLLHEGDPGRMLRRYEGIITRFHDEIRRKDAVTAALKETLAKSMLHGEKLERRVKALEAQH